MIRNIVLDIGNVLAAFCWREVFEELGFYKEIQAELAEATVNSNLWLELDRSARPDAEIMADCIAAAPHLRSEITLFFGHLTATVSSPAVTESGTISRFGIITVKGPGINLSASL